MSTKFQNQLSELVSAEVISADTAQNIRSYYDAKQSQTSNKLFIAFGVLGALLVGLGIILILAHNWDSFSRFTKTIWAFVPLALGQLFAGITYFKKLGTAWRETAATFLFFAVGASISLVSQIYNIPGEMSTFLLTWIALTAPLIYILRSHAVAILHLIYATAYACNVGYFESFGTHPDVIPWLYLLMLAFVLPFYFGFRRLKTDKIMQSIYNWLLPLSGLITLGTFIVGHSDIRILIYVGLFGLFYNIGSHSSFTSGRLLNNGYKFLGSLGMVITLVMATFSEFWSYSYTAYNATTDWLLAILIMSSALCMFIYNMNQQQSKSINLFQVAFALFGLLYFMGGFVPYGILGGTNLLVLSLGIYCIYEGNRINSFSTLNYGFLIIAVLVACRFFDTDMSFVIRGVLFLSVGVGFFLTNYFMYRKQQKLKDYV